jgi:hypothetical protein
MERIKLARELLLWAYWLTDVTLKMHISVDRVSLIYSSTEFSRIKCLE